MQKRLGFAGFWTPNRDIWPFPVRKYTLLLLANLNRRSDTIFRGSLSS